MIHTKHNLDEVAAEATVEIKVQIVVDTVGNLKGDAVKAVVGAAADRVRADIDGTIVATDGRP
jgi:hypothetical protein